MTVKVTLTPQRPSSRHGGRGGDGRGRPMLSGAPGPSGQAEARSVEGLRTSLIDGIEIP